MQKARRNAIRIRAMLLCVPLLVAVQSGRNAVAAPWEFEGSVDAGVIFTDNLTLDIDGLEDEEVVYTITPTLRLFTDSDRIEADLRYRPEAYFFDDRSEFDEIFHSVDMTATGTLVRDALFIFASAANFQSIVSADLPIPTSNVPVNGNRLDAKIISVRPYWQQNLGFGEILMEVAQIDTDFAEYDLSFVGQSQDNVERFGRFRLSNIPDQRGMTWGLNYEHRRVEYKASVPWDYQRAAVDLGYWVTATTRLFVTGGAETDFESFFDSGLNSDLWEVGLQYAPSPRLNFEAAVGERSYGTSYRGDFTYDLRRGQMSITYSEVPTTVAEQLREQNPIRDTDNLETFLGATDGNDRFILKRGEWANTIELAKSDFSLRAFFELRDQRIDPNGMQLDDESLLGVAVRWNWRVGARSRIGLYGDYSDRTTEVTDSELSRFAADYEYNFTPRLSIVAFVQRSDERALDDASLDYTENQYRLILRANFQ